MKRGVILTRYEAGSEVDLGLIGAIRLRIVAENKINMDPNIFVWERLPKSPHQEEAESIASHVASPADMAEFPVGEPNPGVPFFRRSYIDFKLRSTIDCNAAYDRTEINVGVLIDGLKALDALEVVSTVCIGDCEDSDSVSS